MDDPNRNSINTSEILKLGMGVCSAYTNLFISQARAYGIPARPINGFVIHEDEFLGLHNWVEVYLNGRWIPIEPNSSIKDFYTGALTQGYIPLKIDPVLSNCDKNQNPNNSYLNELKIYIRKLPRGHSN